MAASKPWVVRVRDDHAGSTDEEVRNEPDWDVGHEHRVGYRNRNNRRPGITHHQDEYRHEVDEAGRQREELRKDVERGKLVNFRHVIQHQKARHVLGDFLTSH